MGDGPGGEGSSVLGWQNCGGAGWPPVGGYRDPATLLALLKVLLGDSWELLPTEAC